MESTIEKRLVSGVIALGAKSRKLSWIGRRGAPDRIVFLGDRVIFVELKQPGGRLSPHQKLELGMLMDHNQEVFVLGSIEEVDWFLDEVCSQTLPRKNNRAYPGDPTLKHLGRDGDGKDRKHANGRAKLKNPR